MIPTSRRSSSPRTCPTNPLCLRLCRSLASHYGASLTILYVMEDLSPAQSANLQGFIGDERWEDLRQSHEQEVRQILIGKKKEGRMIREAWETCSRQPRRISRPPA